MDSHFFDSLYATSADPWRFAGSWYEARKRSLLLASLPARRYANAYEPGCAMGDLTAHLVERCDHLLASDGALKAVEATRGRFHGDARVQVVQAWLPDDWPAQTFDLIVLSEFLYYLAPADQSRIAEAAQASLSPGGTLVACHWRHPIVGCECGGDAVHDHLRRALVLHEALRLEDADFCLGLWSSAPSPAAVEGKN